MKRGVNRSASYPAEPKVSYGFDLCDLGFMRIRSLKNYVLLGVFFSLFR